MRQLLLVQLTNNPQLNQTPLAHTRPEPQTTSLLFVRKTEKHHQILL